MSPRAPGPAGPADGRGLVAGGIALAVLLAGVAVWIPAALTRPPGYRGGGPIIVLGDLLAGRIRWTGAAIAVAGGELALALALTVIGAWAWQRFRVGHTRVDRAARKMASRAELAALSPAGVADSARRLRPGLGEHPELEETGVLIGTTVVGGMPLLQSWEDMATDIWGPRTGKTTSRAIPAVVAAPGPVVVTSTKGDIVDATREVRAARGQTWVFDPQGILDDRAVPDWWWDPLAAVTTVTAARRLAEHFAAASADVDARKDAFFDTSGEELVANLLLAAAVGNRTLVDVYRWSVSPVEEEPAILLRANGQQLPAEAVTGVLNMPDKTRGSIFATAQKMLLPLTEPSITRWVTPPGRPARQFRPAEFVRSTDTLWLLSQTGPGSPAALIAAFTDAVLLAGELAARRAPGRRLDPPLLSVLDEAANICRIRRLPDLYSFYGSQGLPIITILQSYAQGMAVWGRDGMRKLWSASNVRTYGGGVIDPDWLEELSRVIGEHDVITRSTTDSRGERSVSRQPRRQRILEVADLAALPRGRMIVMASGAPVALARTRPWQQGPYAGQIRASLARWDLTGEYDTTLTPSEPETS